MTCTLTSALWGANAPASAAGQVLLALVVTTLLAGAAAHAQDAGVSAVHNAVVDEAGLQRGTVRGQTLRVAVAGSTPFVVQTQQGDLTGLSVEVWKRVAKRLGADDRLTRAASIDDAIDRLARGEIDVLVGPISIRAARARKVAFTQPYFFSSLAIAAPAAGNLLDPLSPFLDTAFATAAAGLLGALLLVGMLIWVAERRHNPGQFPQKPLRGIGNGVWLALVTATTVGYGDRVPVTPGGRTLMGLWMLICMIGASSFTALVASALTLSQIDRPALATAEQLRGRSVAVVRGTTSQRFARAYRARPVLAPDIDAALALLEHERADALVFDEPILRHALRQRPEKNLQISAATYWPQGYGFAVASGSALQARVTVELLGLLESGEVDHLAKRWL